MKVRFVEHASILIECQNRTILCDPWFVSKVFNDGWALVSPASPPPSSTVDYIWISHEHPDHFNFPTLKGIPDVDKSRIKVLYQRHASPRIVDALLKMGFSQIIELPLYKGVRLERGREGVWGWAGWMDVFLAVRDHSSKECILNLNDCVFNVDQLRYIKRHIGRVSLLFTQFSFANWVGSDGDEVHGAERKIEQFTQQINIFDPEFTVPFASFIYFCNEENCRMNAWANTPDSIARLNLKGVNFMYPGDEWDSDSKAFNSERALEKYRADYANTKIDGTPAAADIARVSQAVEKRLEEFKSRISKSRLKKIRPFSIYVHDLGKVMEVNPAQGTYRILEDAAEQSQVTRYVMCSQVVWYTFAFPWGANTLLISGMYRDREFAKKGWHPFFSLQTKLSTEIYRFVGIQGSLRTLNFWWRKKGEMLFKYTGAFRGQGMVED